MTIKSNTFLPFTFILGDDEHTTRKKFLKCLSVLVFILNFLQCAFLFRRALMLLNWRARILHNGVLSFPNLTRINDERKVRERERKKNCYQEITVVLISTFCVYILVLFRAIAKFYIFCAAENMTAE